MKRRIFGNPVWVVLVMTAALTALQLNTAFYIQQSQYRQISIYAPVLLLAVFAALVAICVGTGPRGALLHWGESSVLLGFTGIAAGANLMINCGLQAWDYYKSGIAPLPYRTVFKGIDCFFLNGTLIFGTLGGAAVLILGLLWMFGGKAGSTGGQWLSLLPIVWAFCRLARYVQSYCSTIRDAFSQVQAAALILSLLFFYMVGQHLNGRLKLNGMGLPFCAFAFGMIAISAFVARTYLLLKADKLIVDAVIVTDVTDLLNGLFAMAVGVVTCSKNAAEKTQEYKEQKEALALQALLEDDKPTISMTTEEEPEVIAEETALVEEPTEEAAEEIVEEPAEETVEEAVEETVEEPVEEIVEDVAEETDEEIAEETDDNE